MLMYSFNLIGKHIGEIDAVMDSWISELGLSYAHFAVLYTLASTPNQQCTQKEICDIHYLPKQTVFNICKDYRERGWIEFKINETDKRERIMCLTDSGKIQAEPVMQNTNLLCDNALATFGEEKTTQLFTLMHEFSQICQSEILRLKKDNKKSHV